MAIQLVPKKMQTSRTKRRATSAFACLVWWYCHRKCPILSWSLCVWAHKIRLLETCKERKGNLKLNLTRWSEVSLLQVAQLLHHLQNPLGQRIEDGKCSNWRSFLTQHGGARGRWRRGKVGQRKRGHPWGVDVFTFGLGPHFSLLIARKSESGVCSLCDLLRFCQSLIRYHVTRAYSWNM